MKTLVKSTIAAIALIAIISCKENNQESKRETINEEVMTSGASNQKFEDEMTAKVWDGYLELKTAFVASNAAAVQTAAQQIAGNLTEDHADMKNLAQEIANEADLEKQRKLFSDFTDKAGPLFKEALASGTMYKQFCPMAFNNTGGFWYSDVSEIRNPYFGDRMLKCGSVKETIEK